MPKSCHPSHLTKSIPFSQALRLRRICSNDESLKKRLGQLKNNLRRRGYRYKTIKEGFQKIHNIPRSSLLQYKAKKKCKRTPCVLTYHPCLKNSHNTIREHWASVERNSTLSKVFPEPPMIAFRQPDSLRSLLVRAEISKPNLTPGESRSCGDKRCKCCNQMHHSSSFTSTVTGKRYKIFCNVHCKSANVIYLLHCPICGLQYVGESKQPFHKRLNGHRSDLTKKPLLPVSQHFRLPNHCLDDFNKMKIFIVEQNTIWSDLQRVKREGFWIKELRVLHPHGINKKH